jgi:hypothetical protein
VSERLAERRDCPAVLTKEDMTILNIVYMENIPPL